MTTDAALHTLVEGVVVERVAGVLAVPRSRVTTASRLVGDLHADSLDLVEIVESVERRLRDEGLDLHVRESQIASWITVGDAVEGIVAALQES